MGLHALNIVQYLNNTCFCQIIYLHLDKYLEKIKIPFEIRLWENKLVTEQTSILTSENCEHLSDVNSSAPVSEFSRSQRFFTVHIFIIMYISCILKKK